MMKFLLSTLCALGMFHATICLAEENPCRDSKTVVGKCSIRHGRLYLGANSHYTFWHIGTTRMFDIDPKLLLPDLEELLLGQHLILFGDFEICPQYEDIPGLMGGACIASATNLVKLTVDEWVELQEGKKKQ